MPIYLLLPLLAAAMYALASMLIKRAIQEGANAVQVFYLSNFIVSLVFLPLLFFESRPADLLTNLWQPVLVGLAFFLGNLTTFLAIRKGDVSVVTPLMGTKVIFVAVFAVLLINEPPTPSLLLAAGLTTAGIFLMGYSDFRRAAGSTALWSIMITLHSSSLFAIHDVLVSMWAGAFGPLYFMVISVGELSVLSVVMWACQGRPRLQMPKSAARYALTGSLLIGLQAILMGISLVFFNDATGVNIVYASRGLWAIAFVVFLGQWLGNQERKTSGNAFYWRIIGTILVTIAVVLAVIDRSG